MISYVFSILYKSLKHDQQRHGGAQGRSRVYLHLSGERLLDLVDHLLKIWRLGDLSKEKSELSRQPDALMIHLTGEAEPEICVGEDAGECQDPRSL